MRMQVCVAWLVIAMMSEANVVGGVTSFTETFRNGFDQTGWFAGDVTFGNGNVLFQHETDPFSPDATETNGTYMNRTIQGSGGRFEAKIDFEHLELIHDDILPSVASFTVEFDLSPFTTRADFVSVFVASNGRDGSEVPWVFGVNFINNPIRTFVAQSGDNPSQLTFSYDFTTGEIFASFDNDMRDTLEATSIGPYYYTVRETGNISSLGLELHDTIFIAGATNVAVTKILVRGDGICRDGDLDCDGRLDEYDLQLLSDGIRNQEGEADLNADGVVDSRDMIVWVHELRNSFFGDANLDGEFSSADLINVFQAGEYEDGIDANSTWSSGDWNGDGEFTTGDLVLAFQDGGYELGPRAAAVPEPSGLGCLLIVMPLLRSSILLARREPQWPMGLPRWGSG